MAADAKSVSLQFWGGLSGRLVRADKRALEDVVANLVSNAVKYTPDGGTVKVKTFAEGACATCEVIDTGIGIPRREQDKLFTEFFRASNAKRVASEGTGLGLTIVKEVVERHGGAVEVHSIENLGTCVKFSVPLETQGETPVPTAQSAPAVAARPC